MAEHLLRNLVPLHNKARQSIDISTGEVVSRRQQQNAMKAEGHVPTPQPDRMIRYQGLLNDYLQNKKNEGTPLTKQQGRTSIEFKTFIHDLKLKGRSKAERIALNAPGGKKAKALEGIGRRPSGASWAVGESDKYM